MTETPSSAQPTKKPSEEESIHTKTPETRVIHRLTQDCRELKLELCFATLFCYLFPFSTSKENKENKEYISRRHQQPSNEDSVKYARLLINRLPCPPSKQKRTSRLWLCTTRRRHASETQLPISHRISSICCPRKKKNHSPVLVFGAKTKQM